MSDTSSLIFMEKTLLAIWKGEREEMDLQEKGKDAEGKTEALALL